jgi:hypothetical protein
MGASRAGENKPNKKSVDKYSINCRLSESARVLRVLKRVQYNASSQQEEKNF